MFVELPIDPSGTWSPRQAARVRDVLNPIVLSRGIRYDAVEITTHGGPARVLLVAYCAQHDIAIQLDDICGWCRLCQCGWSRRC